MKALAVVEAEKAPHVPTSRTRWLVAQLSAMGLDEGEISVATAISPTDLRNSYPDELTKGLAITTAKIGVALVKQARKGDVNAQRFFLQSRARWVVPTKMEVTGKDGGPVEIEHRRKTIDSIVTLVRKRQQVQAAPLAPKQSTEAGGGKPPVTH